LDIIDELYHHSLKSFGLFLRVAPSRFNNMTQRGGAFIQGDSTLRGDEVMWGHDQFKSGDFTQQSAFAEMLHLLEGQSARAFPGSHISFAISLPETVFRAMD
jgi:hypothetical protein